MTLEPFIQNLADPSFRVPSGDFVELSDLSPAELGVFARTWFTIPAERQLWIVSTLVELAEDSAELDFHAIFKMCLKDGDESVVEKAMEGLWEHEDRSVIPFLTDILLSDRSPAVRAAAAVALGKFPLLVQEGKLLAKDGDSIHDSLMAVLVDSEQPHEVRRRSLESIAPFNTSDIKTYVDWAYNSGDLKLKSSSIFAMGRTGETSWLPLLLKEIQSPDPDIRYESAHACGALGEEDAVPHLIGLLEDDDYLVQLAGINALGQIGGPLAKKVLLHCVQEGDASLEEAARAELENIEFSDDPMAFNSSV
ncbi:MAG: HEAT repeat domain-containing protein [Chloroflexi bacterium]|nr:HEAT repeat domain-containing protein [Chloroflexota bacterium]